MKRSDYLREQRVLGKKRHSRLWWMIAVPVLLIIGAAICYNSPVYYSFSWRWDEFTASISHFFNPPDEVKFSDNPITVESIVEATLTAMGYTPTPTLTSPPPTDNPGPSLTPTITPTLMPDAVELEGITYVDQHGRWNYCGPANLTMALKYVGWTGNRDDIARAIKPGEDNPKLDFIQKGKSDFNVMPYELANFVTDETDYRIVVRHGGDIELLKALIANDFPPVIEKGYYEFSTVTNTKAWMGHYLFTTGYDNIAETFTVQDAYLQPGQNLKVDYPTYIDGWRGFNYLFYVVYKPEREAELFDVLGPWADDGWANQHALDIANYEIAHVEGIDEFFAWFNKGTSHVRMQQYADAAFAYDYAFLLYDNLEGGDTFRPYRIMWYETGPYFAYYYTGQYQKVIDLANNTLTTPITPTLEESIYWRGMARLALGETGNAVDDFKETVYLNHSFTPGWDMLNQLGVEP
jgi:tetratricopeptide (TPR) repeat protein